MFRSNIRMEKNVITVTLTWYVFTRLDRVFQKPLSLWHFYLLLFFQKTSSGVYTVWCGKKKKTSHKQQVFRHILARWWERSVENIQTGLSWWEGYGNSNNHSLQLWRAGKHPIMHNTLNPEDKWATKAEDQTGFCSSGFNSSACW